MAAIGQEIPGASVNPNLTTTLAPEVSTYYDKVFLDRAEYELILKEGSQLRTHPANEGRTVNFTRRIPIGIDTSPLGEMSNPVVCAMSACTISMTLSEYGKTVVTSKFHTLVGIDAGQKETIELVGQNMGETLNRLVGTELQSGGTAYYPNGHLVTSLAAGDVLDACNIRLMLRTLELNRARAYKDGMFMGKIDSGLRQTCGKDFYISISVSTQDGLHQHNSFLLVIDY